MKIYLFIILSLIILASTSIAQIGWYPLSSGTSAALLETHFTDTSTGYVIGVSGTIRKTTNSGVNWFPLIIPTNYWLRGIYFTHVDTGYIVSGNVNPPYDGKIFKTTNGGNNWTTVNLPNNNYFYAVDFVNSFTGFVSGFSIILKTTDAGNTWANQSFPAGLEWFYSIDFIDSLTGYASGGLNNLSERYITKTTNDGTNWQIVYTSNEGGYLFGISFIDANTGISVGGNYSSPSIYIIRTTNGGANWDEVFRGNQANFIFSACFVSPEVVYAAGGKEGSSGIVLKSTNGGVNWGFQAPNIFGQWAGSYFLNENTGYVVGTNGRIIKTTDGGGPFIGIDPISNEVPSQFKLYQNYPNPFNPSTSIKFQIPKQAFVILKVIDNLGRETATMVNGILTAGTYEINWYASEYASGIYYYKLNAGDFTDTKKMVLVK